MELVDAFAVVAFFDALVDGLVSFGDVVGFGVVGVDGDDGVVGAILSCSAFVVDVTVVAGVAFSSIESGSVIAVIFPSSGIGSSSKSFEF